MTTWLVNPADTDVETVVALHDWSSCPAAYPVEAVRRTTRGENGDALDTVPEDVPRFWIYPRMGFEKVPDALRLRSEVIKRLLEAEALLPHGLRFVVLDGWRSLAFQQELVTYYARTMESVVAEQYVSNPADEVVAPPHVTGGAVDLTLQFDGHPLGLGTDYDAFEDRADLDWFEQVADDQLSDADRLNKALRRCLSNALSGCGFAHYPKEWWHWSFGDQWWAAEYGHAASLYSEIDLSA